MKRLLYITLALILLSSCSGGKKVQNVPQTRKFPVLEVPAMLTDRQEVLSYAGAHFWDAFFSGSGITDTSAVLGVPNADLHGTTAEYLQIVSSLPLAEGRKDIGKFFDKMEHRHAEDTSAHIYLLLTEMMSDYLYGTDSPYRDEDLYCTFVSRMLDSPYTQDNLRTSCEFEKRVCSLNPRESVATDFRFRDIRGRNYSLHGVEADYIVLFFSNPGCHACGQIMESLKASPRLDYLQQSGRLKVVNIYIDRELDKWREYVPNYPSEWITGYDYNFVIRDDSIYNVRAIPSLYLLGPGKRVIFKDAPTEKVLAFLENIN